MKARILVSACLLGQAVRYDGRDKRLAHPLLQRWRAENRLVAVCPEIAGGLPAPRPAAEIVGGNGRAVLDGTARVQTAAGDDVTDFFLRGADLVLQVAVANGCRAALLTDASPSCGSTTTYSGRFDGHKTAGSGVTAELLSAHGIAVFGQRQLRELAGFIAGLERTARA